MSVVNLAAGIWQRAIMYAGVSYNVKRHSWAPRRGYMVSTHPELERVMPCTPETIARYISTHYGVLNYTPDVYFGLWFDEDMWYYDVSTWVEDRKQARALALKHGQKGIFDLKSGSTIIIIEQK